MALWPPSLDPTTYDPLDRVGLRPLMAIAAGRPEIGIGLVDGPVTTGHPALAGARIVAVGGASAGPAAGACGLPDSQACAHGTFLAGLLVARRGGPAAGICPGCTLLVRPVFEEAAPGGAPPAASAGDVARAIVDCVGAGARVVNLSAATGGPAIRAEHTLRDALDHAAARGAIVVAAAGNQATLGSSEITRHPAVLPVVAYGRSGRPLALSNAGATAGRRGLGAPGEGIVSIAPTGVAAPASGTSFAAAYVTGAIALLWSCFPSADAGTMRRALAGGPRRASVFPPLLDARAAHARLGGR